MLVKLKEVLAGIAELDAKAYKIETCYRYCANVEVGNPSVLVIAAIDVEIDFDKS